MGTAAPAQQQVNRTRSATQRAGRMVDLDLHPQEWGVNTHGLAHGWSGAVGSVVPVAHHGHENSNQQTERLFKFESNKGIEL